MKAAKKLAIALAAAIVAGPAAAAPITPTSDSFDDFATATFGGAGIPTDPTAVTTIVDGNSTITLGLTAHQRYSNPALTNDGAGTFFATPGVNDGLDGGGHSVAGTWNFGFYIDVAGGASFGRYTIRLYYDLDPGAGTDLNDMGWFDWSAFAPTGTNVQDSWNSTFAFLCSDAGAVVKAPAAGCPFDPNAAGEYSFALIATDIAGNELGRAAINVNVASVPEPGTLALLGLGFAGLALKRRRS